MNLPEEFQLISTAVSELKAENELLKERIKGSEKGYLDALNRANASEEAFRKLAKEVDEWDRNLLVSDSGEIQDNVFCSLNHENDELARRYDELLQKHTCLDAECTALRQRTLELERLLNQAPAMSGLIEEIRKKLSL